MGQKTSCRWGDMQRDRRIQLLRVVAMFMIVACHLAQEYNSDIIAMAAQFFNVGVYVFLLISEFLYGGKEIGNFLKWFSKRVLVAITGVYEAVGLRGRRVLLASKNTGLMEGDND